MFLPQVAERDSFDANGKQHDDINSVTEYIDQILLCNTDDTPEDEDNDNGQNFQLVKVSDSFFQQISFLVEQEYIPAASHSFPTHTVSKLASISFEIITPPPEA